MELEVRDKTNPTFIRIKRYGAIAFLVPLLAFFIFRFDDLNQMLLNFNRGATLMPTQWWTVVVKFTSYCMNILLNFCLLLAVTNRLRYSLLFVYVAFAALLVGIALVVLRDFAGIGVPLKIIVFFVKIDKSLILLVLFIAGHIAGKRLKV